MSNLVDDLQYGHAGGCQQTGFSIEATRLYALSLFTAVLCQMEITSRIIGVGLGLQSDARLLPDEKKHQNYTDASAEA
ncbi:hypothetical protein CEXT_269231 [Caerostris extrusa]|uniref:Uncharacterized protein n=1 Tax=Caerostris extrusa TaxID=172846 RepID=A0AAV4MWR7_CAEEX|nr:hypothetical protein CEXT_269231 [Caerostris extrusa]